MRFRNDLSNESKNLIRKIFNPNINKRPTLEEIKHHVWLIQNTIEKQFSPFF